MFSNLIAFRIQPEWQADLAAAEEALHAAVFTPCGATQESSMGLVPARGKEHGVLIEAIDGHWVMRVMMEKKKVPGTVLKEKVEEKAKLIEQNEGRKPGKKELREIKDEVRMELLPAAFPSRSATYVWIDTKAGLLLVDGATIGKCDDIVSLLVEQLQGFGVSLLDTKQTPQSVMALWLNEYEATEGFYIERECELKSSGEDKAVVRYSHHSLDIDEVREHIKEGKMPTKLALAFEGRVQFVFCDNLTIKKIKFMDGVFADRPEDEDTFDADVAITTGELAPLLKALITALGGEGRPEEGSRDAKDADQAG